MITWRILAGDVFDRLVDVPDESVHCVVTSPPYLGLRDYGVEGQIGLERSVGEYVENLVAVFREVRRALRSDGTLWLNLGDRYVTNPGGNARQDHARRGYLPTRGEQQSTAGSGSALRKQPAWDGLKLKDLAMLPARVALALQDDGWWLRSDVIWEKPNILPESVTDRPTRSHEFVFLLSKSPRYWYDHEAEQELSADPTGWKTRAQHAYGGRPDGRAVVPGDDLGQRTAMQGFREARATRNCRTVWKIATSPYRGAQHATFPERLVERCLKLGCPVEGTVLDPFCGSGTTGVVAVRQKRSFVGIELNPTSVQEARRRIHGAEPLFAREIAA